MTTRPMLAEDWDRAKQRYPVIAMAKIDGVRAINQDGVLYGRSLNPHANRYVTQMFSGEDLAGLDGELAAAAPTHPRLVSLTTSAVNTIEGEPDLSWWVFDDYLAPGPYEQRLEALVKRVQKLGEDDPWLAPRLKVVPWEVIRSEQELENFKEDCLGKGYEGVILRDPKGNHKEGRSTVIEGGFLRIKPFVIEEAFIFGFEQGMTNANPAKVNNLGLTERSTHKENLVPNGKIGNLRAVCLKTGKIIKIGPGRMKHDEREKFMLQPTLLIGQVCKYKHFPYGVKDKPRFPTFESFRSLSDLDPNYLRIVTNLKQLWGIS